MDDTDRAIINALQGGFPVSETPYAEAAKALDLDETSLLSRLDGMLANGVMSRFGPLFDAEAMGGAVTLAAIAVPEDDFEAVAHIVNSFDEVAHNYERQHRFNMWFVVSAESHAVVQQVLSEIEKRTGLTVHDMPKQDEFFIGLRLEA